MRDVRIIGSVCVCSVVVEGHEPVWCTYEGVREWISFAEGLGLVPRCEGFYGSRAGLCQVTASEG